MRKFSAFLLAFLLTLMIVWSDAWGLAGEVPSVNEGAFETLPLHVVFVGFQVDTVDTPLIDLYLQNNRQFIYGSYIINWNVNVSYHFADSSFYSALKACILQSSVNGTATTSSLNETALQIQKETGTKMSIFQPQSGRAIDALAVEEWLTTNPYDATFEPSYWFYVVNFTEFDSQDHALEHWYNTTELDFEANNYRDFWRLEWDNALNPNVQFPYACFTSQSRVFLIDPSAFQWYLTWARIWWGLSASGPKYAYYYEDLDEFLRAHDVSTIQGKSDFAAYLGGWLDDGLSNLVVPDMFTPTYTLKAKSVSIQALILNNASDNGYTDEAMKWIINTTLAKTAITDLAPFLNVDVSVAFRTLSDDPILEGIFDAAVIQQTSAWTYYDGHQIWDGLSIVKDSYFNFSAADIVINGYVFLEKNMSMIVYGGEYTGLGGEGQILVMKEVGRYFQEDEISPKSGLGLVLIHEAGHNFGFPHTFVHGTAYAGDFAFDVMGYYPYSFYFTQFRKDCFRRLVVDYKTLELGELMDENLALYTRKPSNPTLDAKFAEVHSAINASRVHYNMLRYLEAYSEVAAAELKASELENLLWIYLCDLDNSGKVTIYDIVELAGAYGSQPGDKNWNPDADLIQDGSIDIYDAFVAAGNYGASWLEE